MQFVQPGITHIISQVKKEQARAKSPARNDVECYHYNPQSSPGTASRSPNASNGKFFETDLGSLPVGECFSKSFGNVQEEIIKLAF